MVSYVSEVNIFYYNCLRRNTGLYQEVVSKQKVRSGKIPWERSCIGIPTKSRNTWQHYNNKTEEEIVLSSSSTILEKSTFSSILRHGPAHVLLWVRVQRCPAVSRQVHLDYLATCFRHTCGLICSCPSLNTHAICTCCEPYWNWGYLRMIAMSR